MVTEKGCPTRLLADTPAETDAFGGHERVARSIVEVLQTERGGRSIGLEGGWGAGKSTIVKLISKHLTQRRDSAFQVSVFDMWAHQDDPLRRTFLENLITRIQEVEWVDKEKWDRRLDELTKRRSEDKTSVVPRLTGAGLFFALTLLAIPVGSALISAAATLLASKDASATLATVLLPLGIAAVLAPAIYYIIVAAIRHLTKRPSDGGGDGDGGLSEFPALVTGQASTESRTIVTHTPDPTSVEFESVFRRLLSEALQPKDRKLLLVIDNLDRVQPSDALSIWSTLQTFLGHSDYRRADWIDRLWVLIPYDGNAILRLWDRSGGASDGYDSTLATSFLDKTFQLRFRVPPLFLLNWRDFLQEHLQEALPHHQEADFHDVYRAFAAKGGLEKSAPTPRDLKILVNQIGTLHRVWQDEFPLSHLACYVLLQRDGEDVHDALLSEDGLDLPRRIIGDQWREVIAALHFGVPLREARQLLLRGPIEAALANGDGDALSHHASTHPTGFWAVLEDSAPAGAQDWSSLAPADLARAATALAESRVLDHADRRPEAAAVRSSLRTAATDVGAWSPFDVAIAKGMVAVARLVADSAAIVPALLAGASKAAVEDLEGNSAARAVSPSEWMDSAFTLVEGLVEFGFVKQIGEGIKVPLDAQQWLDVSLDVAKRDPKGQLLQYFELRAIEAIDELVAQQIENNQMDDNAFNAVHTAMATRSRIAITAVTNQVFSRLQSGESFPGDQVAHFVKTLRVSKRAGLIDQGEYTDFAESSHYLHHLYDAVSEDHPEAVAECMFGFLQAVPDGHEPGHVGNSSDGYQNLIQLLQDPDTVPGSVEHFTALAKETQQLSRVLEMTTGDGPVRPFVAEVLKTLLTSQDVATPPELVRANWAVVREVLEEGEEEFGEFRNFLAKFTWT